MADVVKNPKTAAAAADASAKSKSIDEANADQASKVGTRGSGGKTDKPERVPMRTPEEREEARNRAMAGGSGIGQPEQKGEAAAIAAGRGTNRVMPRLSRRAAMKIIYFINGVSPTVEEYTEAQTLGMGVVFRNARKIVLGAPLENTDAVAGDVPADYARVYPQASAGMEIDDDHDDADLVVRPRRQFGHSTAPDDVRPGTVDTGLAHASGTGSSQPGVERADPTKQGTVGGAGVSEARQLQAEWKSNKTPGNIAA